MTKQETERQMYADLHTLETALAHWRKRTRELYPHKHAQHDIQRASHAQIVLTAGCRIVQLRRAARHPTAPLWRAVSR